MLLRFSIRSRIKLIKDYPIKAHECSPGEGLKKVLNTIFDRISPGPSTPKTGNSFPDKNERYRFPRNLHLIYQGVHIRTESNGNTGKRRRRESKIWENMWTSLMHDPFFGSTFRFQTKELCSYFKMPQCRTRQTFRFMKEVTVPTSLPWVIVLTLNKAVSVNPVRVAWCLVSNALIFIRSRFIG